VPVDLPRAPEDHVWIEPPPFIEAVAVGGLHSPVYVGPAGIDVRTYGWRSTTIRYAGHHAPFRVHFTVQEYV
jgi:hypothetical protein